MLYHIPSNLSMLQNVLCSLFVFFQHAKHVQDLKDVCQDTQEEKARTK